MKVNNEFSLYPLFMLSVSV